MERLAVLCVPLGPLLRDLSNCGVGTTGDVADNSVVADSHVLTFLEVQILQIWEELRVVVGYYDVGSVKSVHLVRKHESAFRVCVVCHHDALRDLSVGSFERVHVMRLN